MLDTQNQTLVTIAYVCLMGIYLKTLDDINVCKDVVHNLLNIKLWNFICSN
jgi:hypothetical protein